MRNFDYSILANCSWDNEILGLISQIHEYKGRQNFFLRQKPVELNRLVEIAKYRVQKLQTKLKEYEQQILVCSSLSKIKQLLRTEMKRK